MKTNISKKEIIFSLLGLILICVGSFIVGLVNLEVFVGFFLFIAGVLMLSNIEEDGWDD